MTNSGTPSCLIVAHNYHPAVGAAATRLEMLAQHLLDAGISVTSMTSSGDTVTTGPSGETVIGTDLPWLPRSRLVRTAVLGLRAAAAARKYDAVVSDPPPHVAAASMIAARLTRRRGVFYYCDSWASVAASRPSKAWQAASRVFATLEGIACSFAHATVAATPSICSQASRWTRSAELVRNGTDLEIYRPDGPRWEGRELPDKYFLYAGTMGLVHGADVFARAAQKLWDEGVDAHVVFVGAGAETEAIEQAAAASNGRIVLMSPVSPEEVAQLYRGCVGALSSMRPVSRYEDAWPIKTLAAMACGAIPVYVSGGDLADDLRTRGLGFVEPYGVDEACRAMKAALDLSDEQRTELGRRCREHAVAEFDQHQAAQAVADTVRRLIDHR